MSPHPHRLASLLLSSILWWCTLPGAAATYTYLRPEWGDSERAPYGVALPNPARAPSLPAERSKLWFSLADLRKRAFIDAASGRTLPPVATPGCAAAVGPAIQGGTRRRD